VNLSLKEVEWIGGPRQNNEEAKVKLEEEEDEDITPLNKGRYAKKKEHWNMILHASPKARINSDNTFE
jgi:hypothetical protein